MPSEDEGQQEVSQEESSPALSSFAQNFLQQVPDDEKPYVQKYLPEWDKGFNKYSQGVQQELGRWKQFGDPDTVQRAMGITQWIQRDPSGFVNFLQEKGYYQPQTSTPVTDDDLEDLPPSIRDKLKKLDDLEKLEKGLGMVYSQQQAMSRQQQEAAELAQLDTLLTQMQGSMKHFNERGVLGLLAAGLDPQEAAQTWDAAIEEQMGGANTSTNGRPTPPVLGQAGSPPVNLGGKRARDLSDNDAKQAAVDILTKMRGSS